MDGLIAAPSPVERGRREFVDRRGRAVVLSPDLVVGHRGGRRIMQARPILVVLKLCALAALVVSGRLLAPTPGPVVWASKHAEGNAGVLPLVDYPRDAND